MENNDEVGIEVELEINDKIDEKKEFLQNSREILNSYYYYKSYQSLQAKVLGSDYKGYKFEEKFFNTITNLPYIKDKTIEVLNYFLKFFSNKLIKQIQYNEKYLFDKFYILPERYLMNCIVISDLHGDIESLQTILRKEDFFNTQKQIIFLGDYIDRGPYQPSVLLGVMCLKFFFPDRVFLLRGNHEYFVERENEFYPRVGHGRQSPDLLFLIFWKKHLNPDVIAKLINFFNNLPSAVKTKHLFFVHGGISRPQGDYENLNYDYFDDIQDLDETSLYEMTWSRPGNKEDVFISGDTDFEFAKTHFDLFMNAINADIMIRGHCVTYNGFELFDVYNNRLITLYSTGNNPDTVEDNSFYDAVNPCYAFIPNKDNIIIKRVYTEEIPVELNISEILNHHT